MLVIGLTGGIATGKSEVSRILSKLGAEVIDADSVGHNAYRPDSQAWREVVEAFGHGILKPTGEVDRKRLGSIVFNDSDARDKLNAIMHPKMTDAIRDRISELREEGARVVVVEAALLIEAGWHALVDDVWVTRSSEDEVNERLRLRNRLSSEEIRSRVSSQLPFEERSKHAHAHVRNSGSMDDLREAVECLWTNRVKGKVL